MHDVGLRIRLIEHALLAKSEVLLLRADVGGLLAERDDRAKLTGQVRVEHVERANRRLDAEDAYRHPDRPAQEPAAAQAFARHLRRLRAATAENLVFLRRAVRLYRHVQT